MADWTSRFLSGTAFAIIGWALACLQRKANGLEEQREAVAALRFELESNLWWLDDVPETHNYLRDEAWVILKNKGYISYLRKPIPMKVIKVYDKLHGLNEYIPVLKEKVHVPCKNTIGSDGERLKTELGDRIRELTSLLDAEYPKIGKNFQETYSIVKPSNNRINQSKAFSRPWLVPGRRKSACAGQCPTAPDAFGAGEPATLGDRLKWFMTLRVLSW